MIEATELEKAIAAKAVAVLVGAACPHCSAVGPHEPCGPGFECNACGRRWAPTLEA